MEDRDPISYLYTSGTTSAPKGVVSSHLAIYLGIARRRARHADDGGGSRHGADAAVPYRSAQRLRDAGDRGRRRRSSSSADSTPNRLLDLIETERLTLIFALPMMYRAMLEQLGRRARDVSSLRLAGLRDGADADHELRKAIETFGCEFCVDVRADRDESARRLFPSRTSIEPSRRGRHAVAQRAGRDHGRGGTASARRGNPGEIVYRSPQVMTGYLRDPDRHRRGLRAWLVSFRRLRPFRRRWHLWFEDRFKDVIKTGGENVASIEVEKALYAADPACRKSRSSGCRTSIGAKP